MSAQTIRKNYEDSQVSGDCLERSVSALEAKLEGIKSFRRQAEKSVPSEFVQCRPLGNAWLQGYEYESLQAQNRTQN